MGVLLSVSREPGFYPLCSHFRCCGIFFFFTGSGPEKEWEQKHHICCQKGRRERKGFKIGHRWENMNILAEKAKEKGTEPLSETSLRPVRSQSSPSPGASRARKGHGGIGAGWRAEICAQHCLQSAFPCGLGDVGVSVSRAPLD